MSDWQTQRQIDFMINLMLLMHWTAGIGLILRNFLRRTNHCWGQNTANQLRLCIINAAHCLHLLSETDHVIDLSWRTIHPVACDVDCWSVQRAVWRRWNPLVGVTSRCDYSSSHANALVSLTPKSAAPLEYSIFSNIRVDTIRFRYWSISADDLSTGNDRETFHYFWH